VYEPEIFILPPLTRLGLRCPAAGRIRVCEPSILPRWQGYQALLAASLLRCPAESALGAPRQLYP